MFCEIGEEWLPFCSPSLCARLWITRFQPRLILLLAERRKDNPCLPTTVKGQQGLKFSIHIIYKALNKPRHLCWDNVAVRLLLVINLLITRTSWSKSCKWEMWKWGQCSAEGPSRLNYTPQGPPWQPHTLLIWSHRIGTWYSHRQEVCHRCLYICGIETHTHTRMHGKNTLKGMYCYMGSDWGRMQSRVLTRMPSCISHVPIEVSAHKSPTEGLCGPNDGERFFTPGDLVKLPLPLSPRLPVWAFTSDLLGTQAKSWRMNGMPSPIRKQMDLVTTFFSRDGCILDYATICESKINFRYAAH